MIGHYDLRGYHNKNTYIGGYTITHLTRKDYYAMKNCELLFKQSTKHQLIYLIMPCDLSNLASSRTCERAGGRLLEIKDVPVEHSMYLDGKRKVMIYRFEL